MRTVTLGGNRLGSGKKMKIELQDFGRSTHNLSRIFRTTASAGTLIPFLCEPMLTGDTWDIYLEVDIKTPPTLGPLFASMKVQLDLFQTAMRLYNSLLHNNALYIGNDMSKAKIPQIKFEVTGFDPSTIEDLDNCQVNPSSIMAYLGVRGFGVYNGSEENIYRYFNAIPLLTYWDIYKNYYANKQLKEGAVIHTNAITPTAQTVDEITLYDTTGNSYVIAEAPDTTDSTVAGMGYTIVIDYTGTAPDPKQILVTTEQHGLISIYDLATGAITIDTVGTRITAYYNSSRWGYTLLRNWLYQTNGMPMTAQPRVATFPLENIDIARKSILKYDSETVPFILNDDLEGTETLSPYCWVWQTPNGIGNLLSSQEGLAIKTYQNDLFNNWLNTEDIEAITTASAISTASGTISMDQINLAEKIYKKMNLIAAADGTYGSWNEVMYGIEMQKLPESPVYIGGLVTELLFQEVVSNSEAGTQPLGTMAAKGRLSDSKKGGNVYARATEASYLMGIFSITGRITYSQGNKWDMHLQTWDDLHVPSLDQIGFQDLVTEQMAWWDTYYDEGTETWVQKSAGKQPAWTNYMTAIDISYGNFAIQNNQMWMTLNRRFEATTTNTTAEIQDLTTYIDPTKFNWIFAQTSLDAMNFWVSIGIGIEARRVMSAKIMPSI